MEYVVVGGLAVAAWAYERATKDTDIVVPEADEANEQRLRAALADLHAEPLQLEAPGAAALGVRWEPVEGFERYQTTAGVLDVMRAPAGAAPYAELRQRAAVLSTEGVPTVYVGREDLIAMKLAAGRIQDVLDLEALTHPANQEAARVKLRAGDRDLLRGPDEPAGLGEPTDPCEREVDQLRQALAPTPVRAELERALAVGAREARALSDEQLTQLAGRPLPEIPPGLADSAARLAATARAAELADQQESALLKERDQTGVWQRRDRRDLGRQLDATTEQIDRLEQQAELEVARLRAQMTTIQDWWNAQRTPVVDAIAARRESYRRERLHQARKLGQDENPSDKLAGDRPSVPASKPPPPNTQPPPETPGPKNRWPGFASGSHGRRRGP